MLVVGVASVPATLPTTAIHMGAWPYLLAHPLPVGIPPASENPIPSSPTHYAYFLLDENISEGKKIGPPGKIYCQC